MDLSENQMYIALGFKRKEGPIERHKLYNLSLDTTVINFKTEAGKTINEPCTSLEAIHHGKILRDNATLQGSGVKYGEVIFIVTKKVPAQSPPAPSFTDTELQQLNTSLRTLGCTPNAPGWTRAMQLLNDDSALSEVIDQLPSLNEDCVALSILHEVELLAALGANVETMRRGADAHPHLVAALRHLTRLVRSRNTSSNDNVPTSGFAYSLEALSEDEDVEDEETEEAGGRNTITREQLSCIAGDNILLVQAASEVTFPGNSTTTTNPTEGQDTAAVPRSSTTAVPDTATGSGSRAIITPDMFHEAITEALTRAEQSNANGAELTLPPIQLNFSTQLSHMQEMGLTDEDLNIRALLICSGDVNAAINLVFSGLIDDY